MIAEETFAVATRNRLLAADMFATLHGGQWETPSLCVGWTVREVLAHLVPPEGGFTVWRLAKEVARFRGDLERMVDVTTRERAREVEPEVLVAQLRERSAMRLDPPVTGAAGPMADTAIHLRDAARPLGLDVCPPPEDWRPVLDFLVSKPAARGFMPRGRLKGLRLVATDLEWVHGEGLEVRGPAEALSLAVSGRGAALPDLGGPGLSALIARLVAGS
jgi:uncharacterized protein (TIGR03083 family)